MDPLVSDLVAAIIANPEDARPLVGAEIRRAAWSDDIETLGALCHLLDKAAFRDRIEPPLSFDEHQALFLRFYERCLLEDPGGEWSGSRYEAGWSLTAWFRTLWNDSAVPRPKLLEIKRLLATLYKNGDSAVRTCIVNATLEHLFEDRRIASYFRDWTEDVLLAEAYADASLWSGKDGKDGKDGKAG
jgi:hypothetical protein